MYVTSSALYESRLRRLAEFETGEYSVECIAGGTSCRFVEIIGAIPDAPDVAPVVRVTRG